MELYLTSLKCSMHRTRTGRASSLILDIWHQLGPQDCSFVCEGRDLCGCRHSSIFTLLTLWGTQQVSERIGTSCTLEFQTPGAVLQTILFSVALQLPLHTICNTNSLSSFLSITPQHFGYVDALYLNNAVPKESLSQFHHLITTRDRSTYHDNALRICLLWVIFKFNLIWDMIRWTVNFFLAEESRNT